MQAALVLDTCGGEGYVAVFPVMDPEPQALSERCLGVRATQEELLPAIESAVRAAGLELRELAAVVVVRGPGSFTGVRIGLATAKGLCEAAGLPLVGLSRLHVLASATAVAGRRWAWLQAGRGEVYAQQFDGEDDSLAGIGTASGAPDEREIAAVLPLEQAVELAGAEPVAVCEPALSAAVPKSVLVSPAALQAALRAAAALAIRQQRWSDAALTDALYLRVPDAELALRARQA